MNRPIVGTAFILGTAAGALWMPPGTVQAQSAHASWSPATAAPTKTSAAAPAQPAYDCLIEPHAVVQISTREQGVIEEVAVKRGDLVKKGQVLVRLESEAEKLAAKLAAARAEMRAQIDGREANLSYLKAQEARLNELYAKKAVPFLEKHKAATDTLQAEAELREAKESLALLQIEKDRTAQLLAERTIRSTVDGVVVDVLLDPGESVEDRPIIVVAEVDPLNVEIILPEARYGSIKIGDKAQVTPLLPDAAPRETVVTVVDRVVDAASKTFGVRLELRNPTFAIPGGVRCEIQFHEAGDAKTRPGS